MDIIDGDIIATKKMLLLKYEVSRVILTPRQNIIMVGDRYPSVTDLRLRLLSSATKFFVLEGSKSRPNGEFVVS